MTITNTASALLLLTLMLGGCSDSDNNRGQPTEPEEPRVPAQYDSAASPPLLPFPNAVYQPVGERLALPLPPDTDPDDLGNALVATNTLDGFSTSAPIRIDFTESIDSASISAGNNVRLFEAAVSAEGLPIESIIELQPDLDYQVSVSAVKDSTLLIKPLRPLQPSAHYVVGVSDGLLAASGLSMGPSEDYIALREGENSVNDNGIDRAYLADLVRAQEDLLADNGMLEVDIATSLSFRTHATSTILDSIAASVTPAAIALTRPDMLIEGETLPLTSLPLAALAAAFGLAPSGQVDLYTGTFELPYYMNIPTDETDDTVYDSYLRDSNGEPILDPTQPPVSAKQTVPILVAIPNGSRDANIQKPAAGWPVAIYQHGITGNRTNLLLIADRLAELGVASIAIDQPMHGVLPRDANIVPLVAFTQAGVDFYVSNGERHYDLDLNGDGVSDAAGDNYGSPRNLLTFRDNLRQAASDMVYLAGSLPALTLPGEPVSAFDADRIHYLSLSLGSMVGTLVAGLETNITAFSLSAPGGGISKFNEGAPNANAGFIEALAALGLEQGTQEYEDYLALLTTIEGPGDPVNYAVRAGQAHPIHLTEIVGDGTPDNLPDQTIPNDVLNRGQYEGLVAETSPLAGTEPLARLMTLDALIDDSMNPEGLKVIARFVRGDHQSQVNPLPDREVTAEIQTQTATFLASDGKAIDVDDSSLVEMNYLAPEP